MCAVNLPRAEKISMMYINDFLKNLNVAALTCEPKHIHEKRVKPLAFQIYCASMPSCVFSLTKMNTFSTATNNSSSRLYFRNVKSKEVYSTRRAYIVVEIKKTLNIFLTRLTTRDPHLCASFHIYRYDRKCRLEKQETVIEVRSLVDKKIYLSYWDIF